MLLDKMDEMMTLSKKRQEKGRYSLEKMNEAGFQFRGFAGMICVGRKDKSEIRVNICKAGFGIN